MITRQGQLLLQKRTAQERATFHKEHASMAGRVQLTHTLREAPSRQAQLSPALQSSARCQGGGGANRSPRGKRTDRSTSAASPWRSDHTATEHQLNWPPPQRRHGRDALPLPAGRYRRTGRAAVSGVAAGARWGQLPLASSGRGWYWPSDQSAASCGVVEASSRTPWILSC